jgi:hypothetical protein
VSGDGDPAQPAAGAARRPRPFLVHVATFLLVLSGISWLAWIPLETWYIRWVLIPSLIIPASRIHSVTILLGLYDCTSAPYLIYLIWGAGLAARSLWAGGKHGAPMAFALYVPIFLLDCLITGSFMYLVRVAPENVRGAGWALLTMGSATLMTVAAMALLFVPQTRRWDTPLKYADPGPLEPTNV